MKSNKNRITLILGLLMAVMLAFGLGPKGAQADDVDVYMTTVQNTALVVADDSGSMSFPVYDGSIDFSNFMKWMRDPNGDENTSDALAYDKEDGRCAYWWNAHTLEAERYDAMSGVLTATGSDSCGSDYVRDVDNNDWLQFNQVDFGNDGLTKVRARVKGVSEDGGKIEFWIDDPTTGTRVGTISLGEEASSNWHMQTATLTSAVTGVHDLYVKFRCGDECDGGDLLELNWFHFTDSGWENYDKLDPDQIFLVSAISRSGFTLINYTDKDGNPQEKAQVGDFMEHWGTSHNERDDYIINTIVEIRNSSGELWRLPEVAGSGEGTETGGEIPLDLDLDMASLSIQTEKDATDGLYYVIFPTTTVDVDGVVTVTNNYGGQRLTNAQDVQISNLATDPRTGIVTDVGFLGHLRSAGYYFAGVFEESGGQVEFTTNHDLAEKEDWRARVYLFATGKFLNFIKLVEDFMANNRTVNPPGVPSFAYDWAWTNICDKSAGTDEPSWSSQSTTIYSHDKAITNYGGNPVGDFLKGVISPPGADGTEVSAIKVKFEYIDTEWCQSGTANDYVDLQDGNGNSLLAIKGQEVKKNGSGGSGAAISYDGGETWIDTKNILDQGGYTEPLYTNAVRVIWHKGKSGKNCSGSDKGFKITGFQFSTQAVSPTETQAGNFYCMNGTDGYGLKVRTRNEVAKEVLHKVIDATSNSLIWGFNVFNSSPEAQLGSSIDDVKAAVDSLKVSGGTPMSEALQDGYENSYSYFEDPAHADEAECANKFVILMTDGYPNGDNEWNRINLDGSPVFDNLSNPYVDDDGWIGLDGNDNYGDDVAKWMYDKDNNGWATHKHTVHTIGFGLDHPLLGDIANSSGGIYITAFNEGQLINAFHSLSLAMTESQSFVAPVVSVDQANRTQSGDKIYTAFFRPKENDYWVGNLKKYGLRLMTRGECGRTKSEWVVVGSDNQPAVDCYGNFYPNSKSIWAKVADGGEADKGGVGALLKDAMPGPHPRNLPQGGKWWDFRNMFTYDSATSSMVRFIRNNITSTDLGVADDVERDKVVNFMYGYEFGVKDITKGSPQFKREWVLGDMVHSEPTIIDYLDKDNGLEARFIVAGANDGMLHVFTDQAITLHNAAGASTKYEAGREIWAFIPEDLLLNLKNFADPSVHHYSVDGFSSLYRARTFNDDSPSGTAGIRDADEYYDKTLVFSERRGGNSYWALDVSKPNPMDWTVKWHIQGGGDPVLNAYYELNQTWSKPIFSRIQMPDPDNSFKDVVIFAGGYDPEEDGYPEAWDDDDEDGIKDSGESHTDTAGGTASTYDYFNPDTNEYGRGIYVVDLDTGDPVFRAVYANADSESTDPFHGNTPVHGFTTMKWSFPADTTVVPLNLYRTATDFGYRKLVIYVPDVYGTIWKVVYDYAGAGETNKNWQARRIFSTNPGSNQGKALDGVSTSPSTVSSDWGRKMFYPPDVSYRGTTWTDYPTLFVGTGDRPHPRYMAFNAATSEGYHDRFYVVADSEDPNKPSDDATYPINETYLLNLTCDELENAGDVDQDGTYSPDDTDDDPWRAVLRNILFHRPDPVDADTFDCSDPDCDYPVNNQYARGWYRIIGKQGDCTQDSRDHTGEKVLSRPTLFFKVAYFTTFQPYFGDPCRPSGDALLYALDYDVGTAAFNFNLANDDVANDKVVEDLSDTYSVVQDSTIASGVRVITRGGKAAGVFSAGGSIVGAGEEDGSGTSTSIPGPPGGASRIMWETF